MSSETIAAPLSLRRPRLVLPALVAAAAAVVGAGIVLAARSSMGDAGAGPSTLALAAFEQETGVRVVSVAVTGGGGMIDFRYQVIDPDRAVVLQDRQPVLLDEDSGEVIDKIWGHQAHREFVAGRTYYLLFVNRQGLIQTKNRASVWVGDTALEHVVVQ